jgi:hypothetical protein
MKVKRVNGLDIKPPKKNAFMIDTPDNLPKLHTLMIASGRRGGGKSVAVSNFVRMLLEKEILDRVILISPTYYSNKEIYDPLNIAEEDIIEPSKDAVKEVVSKVEQDKAEYDEFLEKLKKYKEYQKLISSDTPIYDIPPMKLIEFMEYGFLEGEKPEWKYKHERLPRVFLIIDDCMGTDLFNRKSGLTNLCIKHRHIAEGTGISIAMLTQSYCANEGLPRPIRENTCLLLLFKNTQEQQIKKIFEEAGDKLTEEQFYGMFNYATSKPFGFMMIDFHPKSDEMKYRSNFNEFLNP